MCIFYVLYDRYCFLSLCCQKIKVYTGFTIITFVTNLIISFPYNWFVLGLKKNLIFYLDKVFACYCSSGSGLAFCQLLVRSQKAGPAPRYVLNSESGNARLLTLFKNKH